MTFQHKKYDIMQCALYKCNSPHNLKKVLKITDEEYKDIVKIVKYHSFQIDKNMVWKKEILLHLTEE